MSFESATPEGLAKSLTLVALRGMRRHNEKMLDEIKVLDSHLGEVGREAREAGRRIIAQKLEAIDRAIQIKESGNG